MHSFPVVPNFILLSLQQSGIASKIDNTLPSLVNLNEDPMLSEILVYVLKEGKMFSYIPSSLVYVCMIPAWFWNSKKYDSAKMLASVRSYDLENFKRWKVWWHQTFCSFDIKAGFVWNDCKRIILQPWAILKKAYTVLIPVDHYARVLAHAGSVKNFVNVS